jgi:hypothetical protein
LTEPDARGRYSVNPDQAQGLQSKLDRLTVIPGKFGQLAKWPDLEHDALLD